MFYSNPTREGYITQKQVYHMQVRTYQLTIYICARRAQRYLRYVRKIVIPYILLQIRSSTNNLTDFLPSAKKEVLVIH